MPAHAGQCVEVDFTAQQFAQRIQVQRVEVVRRGKLLKGVGQDAAGVGQHGQEGHHAGQVVVQRCQAAGSHHAFPDVAQLGACGLVAVHFGVATQQPVDQRHGVDRAGTGTADAFKFESAILQQRIQHTPGECTVRTSTLQGKVHALACRLCSLGGGSVGRRWAFGTGHARLFGSVSRRHDFVQCSKSGILRENDEMPERCSLGT